MPSPPPIVVAVSRKPAHTFSKQPQLAITLIAGEGVEGDAHRGTTTQHLYFKRKDPTRPNLAQVHLFAAEMLDELQGKGFNVAPGDLGENILTRNLDLLTLPTGTLLHLGDTTLEVTGLRTPCSQIDAFQKGVQEQLWGPRDATGQRTRRAGIMSIVRKGGTVTPNTTISLELPPLPHKPLGPV